MLSGINHDSDKTFKLVPLTYLRRRSQLLDKIVHLKILHKLLLLPLKKIPHDNLTSTATEVCHSLMVKFYKLKQWQELKLSDSQR